METNETTKKNVVVETAAKTVRAVRRHKVLITVSVVAAAVVGYAVFTKDNALAEIADVTPVTD